MILCGVLPLKASQSSAASGGAFTSAAVAFVFTMMTLAGTFIFPCCRASATTQLLADQ
jgi:hypothetical protein